MAGTMAPMRVHIATDHAGFELKEYLVPRLAEAGYDVVDHGAAEYDALDDYPPMCIECGKAVVADPGSLGIVLGGSGNGEQIAANKVPGVRAILAWNESTAELGREHNDANVVSIGARRTSPPGPSSSSEPSWRRPSAEAPGTGVASACSPNTRRNAAEPAGPVHDVAAIDNRKAAPSSGGAISVRFPRESGGFSN